MPLRNIFSSNKFQLLYWYDLINTLPIAVIILILLSGVLLLFHGKSIFKWIVILNAAGMGAYIGWSVGLIHNRPVLFAIGLGVVVGILAWPLLRLAVALLCGIIGIAVFTQIVFVLPRLASIQPMINLAGFIIFAILGWFLLIPAVILFTSIEGAGMIILAGIAILERMGIVENGRWIVFGKTNTMIFFVLGLAMLGLIYQLGVGESKLVPPVEVEEKKSR